MYISFDELPGNARIWWYQADRNLSPSEIEILESKLRLNMDNWLTHGMPMKGSFTILFDRVILIGADTDFQSPSGCSIDSSTRWLKDLGAQLGLQLFDRSIGYFKDDELNFISFFDAKKVIQEGHIQSDTKILNTQISSKDDVDTRLTIPASETFLKRYFEKVTL